MSQEKFEKTFSLLKGVLEYDSFRDVDLVIEVKEITGSVDNLRLTICSSFSLLLYPALSGPYVILLFVLNTGRL